jgi:hypothetical protein
MVPATGQWKCSLPTWAAQPWVALRQDAAGTWPGEEPLGPHWQGKVMQHLEAFAAALEWEDSQVFVGQMPLAAQAARNRGQSEAPLLHRTDQALYQSKNQGCNRVTAAPCKP